MSFIDTRLDECVAYGFSGGPEWSTQVVALDNGREVRNAQWLYPRHRYAAQYMNLRPDARDAILAAFHACRGQLHAFRFKDWNDYTATAQPLVQSGGVWRLAKIYSFGSESSVRLIQAPSSVVLTGGDGEIDMETGIYSGDGEGVTWSGEFDVWVRFESDYNAFTIGSWQAHTADVALVEVRR